MTDQRLQYLFAGYIRDILTPDEKAELMTILSRVDNSIEVDEIIQQLWLDSGEPDAPVDLEGERRIQNVMKLITPPTQFKISKKFTQYRWLKAAAVFIIAMSVGLWLINRSNKANQVPVLVKNTHSEIHPGGNNAYLTMANGSRIVLNNVKNGNVAIQAGMQINKVKNSILLYQSQPDTAHPDVVVQYNTLTTPRGGQYQLVLADGTKAWLNAASSIKFPVAFSGPERKVEITGEVYFEVAKNKAKPFIVRANQVDIRVLGTHFNVSAYPDDPAVVTTLMEGSVRMSKEAASVMLAPGQQAIAINNNANITLQPADIEATEAWRKGLFIFHDESIVNVMKIMARWYDVDVDYQGDIRNKEFGGSISKNNDISVLLENMRLTGAIHYKIEGRRIIVMK